MATAVWYVGLMSGTSMDGMDAVLARFDGDGPEVGGSFHAPMPEELHTLMQSMIGTQQTRLDDLLRVATRFADLSADAVKGLLTKSGVASDAVVAIGSHGQTLCHRPDLAASFQVDDPSRLAARTGIDVVADFRRRDLAAGGQGAPLAPAFHADAFQSDTEDRVILNLGGIANITFLPASGETPASGFDTGPANTLLDAWYREHRDGRFDTNGDWARSGAVDRILLAAFLDDPYFRTCPPKSTGREHFHRGWVEEIVARQAKLSPADVQATLTELTAISVAQAIRSHCCEEGALFACGGGTQNGFLMERLAANLTGFRVDTTDALGIPPQLVEAAAFAWLAYRNINRLPGNLPGVTGAEHAAVLGGVYPA